MAKILIVEDSPEAFELVRRALGTSIQLEWVKTQREAANLLQNPQKRNYDLILLDAHLPDGDGFQLCSLLQTQDAFALTPIIMITSRNSISDRILSFSVGATDFIAKPFDALELKARVEARLRKRERTLQATDMISCNGLEICKSTQKASLTSNGQTTPLDLTPIEFKLLLHLAGKPDVVVSRDELLNTVWGEHVHVYNRSVDTHISKLRKKFGEKSHYIASVHGVGYRFLGQAPNENNDRPLMSLYGDSGNGGLQFGRMG